LFVHLNAYIKQLFMGFQLYLYLWPTLRQHFKEMIEVCVVNDFTRKKLFMAILAFEDDSHFVYIQ